MQRDLEAVNEIIGDIGEQVQGQGEVLDRIEDHMEKVVYLSSTIPPIMAERDDDCFQHVRYGLAILCFYELTLLINLSYRLTRTLLLPYMN